MSKVYSAIEELMKEEAMAKSTRFRDSISGTIKKEISQKIMNRTLPFPIKVKITEVSVRYYFFNQKTAMARREPLTATQRAILNSAKALHKKEIARIKKAFKTIESNIINEIQDTKGVEIEKIVDFVKLMWLNEEFFIAKEKIRSYVYAFSVFYSGCKPKKKKQSKKISVSHEKY